MLRGTIAASLGGTSIYGPLSTPIVLLIWLYFLAIAILIGAALNAAIRILWPVEERPSARARAVSWARDRISAGGEGDESVGGSARAARPLPARGRLGCRRGRGPGAAGAVKPRRTVDSAHPHAREAAPGRRQAGEGGPEDRAGAAPGPVLAASEPVPADTSVGGSTEASPAAGEASGGGSGRACAGVRNGRVVLSL